MDHRYLRYFIAVAEELSFTRAAERLHTVQPSLSQQIRRLEEIVGTPLFHREKHRLHLTEAGRIFLQESRAILQYTDRAIALARQAARAEAGYMTIGFVPGVEGKIFPRILPILRAKYPDIELSLRSLTSPQQLEALQNREINIGFMRPPVDDPEINTEVILRDKIIVALPANHPLTKMKRVPVKSLVSLPLLQVSRSIAPLLHDKTKEISEKAEVTFNSILPAEGVLMSLSEVASGLGFCLLPDYVRQMLPPNVVVRPLDCDPEPEIPLLVAHRKDDRLPALAFFLSLLREQLREEVAGGEGAGARTR
jgi:LysR family transcriptional regulator, hca operon transcriptional activator